MYRCSGCRTEFESRECFARIADDDETNEEFVVFDGEELRNVCPKCGGLICRMEEPLTTRATFAGVR